MGVAPKPVAWAPADFAAGERLGIRPCPRCGDPLGARYPVADGPGLVCWPCAGYDLGLPATPTPRPRQKLMRDTWASLERHGKVFALSDGSRTLGAMCPACEVGVVAVQILGSDTEPRLHIPDEGCSAGCDWRVVAEALG